MRTCLCLALLAALLNSVAIADEPSKYGEAVWAKDFPKARPAKEEIELFGTYQFNPGVTVKAVRFSVTPRTGGLRSTPIDLVALDGKWGALDPKNKTRVIPAVEQLEKGEWTVWIVFTLEVQVEPKVIEEVKWLLSLKNVEVK